MKPTSRGGIADRFADGHGKGDDVVLHARFEFVDSRDIHFGAGANRGGRFFRDLACFGKSLRGGKLHFQPLGELVAVVPNVVHLLARIAWYQMLLPKSRKKIARAVPGVSFFHDTADGEMEGTAPITR